VILTYFAMVFPYCDVGWLSVVASSEKMVLFGLGLVAVFVIL
jgi:hypothetical protein